MSGGMVAGIIVTHGNLGDELLRTAKRVFGEFGDCYALSNEGKSTQGLTRELRAVVDSVRGQDCIIFVDFVGGSCSHACLSELSRQGGRPEVPIIAGVNLPMLLAFLNKRDKVPFEELPGAVIERGCKSIQALDPSKI